LAIGVTGTILSSFYSHTIVANVEFVSTNSDNMCDGLITSNYDINNNLVN